jgi:hypothetical protein
MSEHIKTEAEIAEIFGIYSGLANPDYLGGKWVSLDWLKEQIDSFQRKIISASYKTIPVFVDGKKEKVFIPLNRSVFLLTDKKEEEL